MRCGDQPSSSCPGPVAHLFHHPGPLFFPPSPLVSSTAFFFGLALLFRWEMGGGGTLVSGGSGGVGDVARGWVVLCPRLFGHRRRNGHPGHLFRPWSFCRDGGGCQVVT